MTSKAQMRVLIVEDRPLARDRLRYLLSQHPDIQILAVCEDTTSAWPFIVDGKVDGVFLDIDIETEGNRAGLELALRIHNLHSVTPPWVVFTTGFDEWALEAHKVRPFGYLVKPLRDAELDQVLCKIREASSPAAVQKRQLIKIKTSILIQGEMQHCTRLIYTDEIQYVQAENGRNAVRIKMADGEVFEGVKITLDKWGQHVHTLRRIHKSHLINMQYVSGYQPNPFSSEGYHVMFKHCDDLLPISKTKKEELVRELEAICQFL